MARDRPGKLVKTARLAGTETVHVADWTDARGRRRKQNLSFDRRVAERGFAKIIRERDLETLDEQRRR